MSTKYIASNWRLLNKAGVDSYKSDNYGLSFDGTEYIQINPPSTSTINLDSHSFSFWVNFANSSGYGTAIRLNTASSDIWVYVGITTVLGVTYYIGTPQLNTTTPLTQNAWHHIVCTFDGSTNIWNIYIDKVKVADKTQASSIGLWNQTTNNLLGASNDAGTEILTGQLSEVAIFDYALSDGGVSVGEIAGGQISTLYGSSSLGAGNPMALKPQPVAYYPLGDNSASNPLTQPNEAVEDASVFDFIPEDYIDCGTSLGNQLGNSYTGDITVSMWFNADTVTSDEGLFAIKTGSSFGNITFLIAGSTARMYYNNDGTFISGSISTNQWYNLVGVLKAGDASNTKLYLNGSAVATATTTPSSSLNFSGMETWIGNYWAGNNGFDGEISNVAIWNSDQTTEISNIYNSGVPATTYTNTPTAWYKLDQSANWDVSGSGNWTIPDASGNGNDGISSGMTSANLVLSDLTRAVPYDSYSFNFDAASSDYIDCGDSDTFSFGNSSTDEAFSVSAWIKMNTITNFVVLSKYGATASLREYAIGFSPDKIYILLYDAIGAFRGRYYNTSITSNDWLHIATTYNGVGGTNAQDGIKIYINGTKVDDSTYSSGSYTAMSNTTSELRIGSYSTTYADGKISNVSLFNEELTSTEVLKLYSNGVPQDLTNFTPAPIAWWPLGSNSFWNGSQWTVRDMSTGGSNDGTGQNIGIDGLVGDSPRSEANGTGTNMDIPTNLEGSTKWSSNNSYSINMSSEARTTDVP